MASTSNIKRARVTSNDARVSGKLINVIFLSVNVALNAMRRMNHAILLFIRQAVFVSKIFSDTNIFRIFISEIIAPSSGTDYRIG